MSQTNYTRGALFGFSAVFIWASWIAVTRLGVKSALSVSDLTFLRFFTCGVLLAPIVWRRGLALDKLGWPGLLILVAGAGAPYVLVASSGLRYASAALAGALMPGSMPLFVMLFAVLLLKERVTRLRLVGYGAIVAGDLLVISGAPQTRDQALGVALCLCAACTWASYAIVLRRSKLDPLHAAALVSTGSGLLYSPIYLATQGFGLFDAPLRDIVAQALFQGVLVSIVALYFFGQGIAILGASAGAAFGALTPAMAALLAIPILGETPQAKDWIAIFCVSFGVYLASGGSLPRLGARAER
jgi:drug/metabolite transporter (DMT)-like permease